MKSSTSYILLITAALMWSLGGIFIKLVDLNPMGIAGIRSLGAAVVLLIYIKKPRLYWNRYFLTGVLAYTAMVVLYVLSIRLTTAANAIFLEFLDVFTQWDIGLAIASISDVNGDSSSR